MLIPIRCWSCGKPLAHLWEEFEQRVKKGEDPQKVLDDLGVDRYCCRQQILGNVDLMDKLGQFKKN